jgi:AcrR family transcriptional regulator
VGIRSPSLYNHFRKKEALSRPCWSACCGVLRADGGTGKAPVTYERVFLWLETIVRQHHANPNLARLLQHAACPGAYTNELIDRLFRPMFQPDAQIEGCHLPVQDSGCSPGRSWPSTTW